MAVEQEQIDKKKQIFILPCSVTIVESYNCDTKKIETVEEELTCGYCSDFLNNPGYCPDKKVAMSPRYHCNKSEKIRKMLEKALV